MFKKKVVGGTYTRVHLDRALGLAEWCAQFLLASLTHLMAATLDHCPIYLDINGQVRARRDYTFRYKTMWEMHGSWQDTIQACWSEKYPRHTVEELRQKLEDLSKDLSRWNKDTFGSVQKEIKSLKMELEWLRCDPGRVRPSHVEIKINEKLV